MDIQRNVRRDPTAFWTFINSKRESSRIPCRMYCGDSEYTDPNPVTTAFMEYFASVYESSSDVLFSPDTDSGCADGIIPLPVFTGDDVLRSARRMKPKMSCGPDGIPYFIVRDCVGALAQPLAELFNLSIRSLIFPTRRKLARVSAVHKKGDRSDIRNYRPISLLCGFSKLFEMCVYDCIYPGVRPQISRHQHGFMTERSTVTNLASFSQFISEVVQDKGQVDVVYTDFTKAFDKVSHSLLIHKLYNFGFSG